MIERWNIAVAFALAGALPMFAAIPDEASAQAVAAVPAETDAIFERWRLEAHVPGLVYGIVKDGRLIAVRGQGVQDTVSQRPVGAQTRFRIASMSKAFTALAILKLRDDGKLSLDALAQSYVPEMRDWAYPSADSRRIRVRDLLNHTAGFVTDDPWGDRQQPLPEAEFTALLKAGVPFSRPPGSAMEYSNLGYAILGRVIANVSGQRYQDYIAQNLFKPLGMTSTGFDIHRSPPAERALGYRWQDGAWLREPDMADGAFGAMGGIETTAEDYARWVAFLLSAWPPRDGPETGPMTRATVREIVEGSNFAQGMMRAPAIGTAPCRTARAYGMGWRVIDDCDLGLVLNHGGGFPGYGSHVLLLPDQGVGVFAFTNRTYSGPSVPVFNAALALKAAGVFAARPVPVSTGAAKGYAIAQAIWAKGTVARQRDGLAMNFLMDRDEPHWRGDLKRMKGEVGACRTDAPVIADSAMQGRFSWICERGGIEGTFLLAPTPTPALQSLSFSVAKL